MANRSDEIDLQINEAFAHLDAAMPTVFSTVEHLGNTDEARTFWLAQKSLEAAHAALLKAMEGER